MAEAGLLDDEQIDRVISFARFLRREPAFFSAPPEALASIDRGLAELDRGEKVGVEELARRLKAAASRA